MALKSSREGLRKELVDYLGNIIVDDNLRNEIIKAVGDIFVTSEVLNENVNNLTMQITTENGERIEADNTLQNNITAEATAREDADTTLQNNITAEATAREDADTTLQNNITAEATAREGADTTLQNNINAETTARQEAVTNLEKLISISGGKFYGIDTSNVIASGNLPYTANQDCWLFTGTSASANQISFYINGKIFTSLNAYGGVGVGTYIPLKNGQQVTCNVGMSYVVYGIKE